MTVALCTSACGAAGFTLSGVEYAQECCKYLRIPLAKLRTATNPMIDCGDSFSNGGAPAPGGISDCNMLCAGNSSEYCGAGNRLDVYQSTGGGATATTTASSIASSSTGGPSHVASVGAYTWAGCYTEATNGRALTGSTDVNYKTMTVEICAAFCASYTMFGVEYSKYLGSHS